MPLSAGHRVRAWLSLTPLRKKHKLRLPLPNGLWRVIWFGQLAPLPKAADALGIHTFFLSSGVPTEARRIESVLLSLAHMPLLHIGAEIEIPTGNIKSARPSTKLKTRTVTLNFDPSNIELINRSSLVSTGITADLANTPRYDSYLIRVSPTLTTAEVLIPCPTLFLFFWGVSSPLLDAAITDKLLNPERYIFNPDNTDLEANPVRIEVRRRWSDDEAPYLVTLLKEPGAIEAGQRIFKRIAAERMADPTGFLSLEVWPPFKGTFSVTGLFREVGDALLLTHMMSIDLTPNWTELELYREGGRRVRNITRVEEEDVGPPRKPQKNGSSIGPTAEIEMNEVPGGYGHGAADLPAVAALNVRFPSLLDVKVNRPFNSDPTEQVTRKRRKLTKGPWTAINGRELPQGNHIKGKIVGDESHSHIGDATDEANSVPLPFDDQLTTFADLLIGSIGKVVIDNAEYDIHLDFWNPYRGVTGANAPCFFELPRSVDGENLTWLYRDPDCRRTKRGICVRVTARNDDGHQVTRFIIDLERRIPQPRDKMTAAVPIKTGLMVVWFNESLSPIDTCMNMVIVLADAARNRSPAVRVRPLAGVRIATIRHGTSLSQIFVNALTTSDQCIARNEHRKRLLTQASM